MAESSVVRTKRDGAVAVTDGTLTYTVAKEAGDFNWDVPLYTVNHFANRGAIGTPPDIRKGDDQPMTLGWTYYLRDLGDTASPQTYQTMADILTMYDGGYTDDAWTSTMGTSSDVETWTVQYTIDGSAFGESDKTLTFPYCTLRGSHAEGDPSTGTVTGTSWALKPTLS